MNAIWSRPCSPWKIEPPASPKMRSRSGGASTSWWISAPGTFGACSARMSRQRCAYASRAPSGQPSSSGGPYWVNIVITQLPSSLSEGSTELGTSTSMYGPAAGSPRTASCQARSR